MDEEELAPVAQEVVVPEVAAAHEPDEDDEYEQFHRAFHVVMNQLTDDGDPGEVMDYVGCMKVVMMLFSVAKKDGIVHEVINNHLDSIMETLFHCDL